MSTEIPEDKATTVPLATNTVEPAAPARRIAPKAKPSERNIELKESAQDAADEAASVKGANHDDQLSGNRVRVTFDEQDVEDGDKPIFCSLNGYAYQIPRNTPVDIPVELLEVFENAKTDVYGSAAGGQTSKRTIKRFSYTVHAV